MARMSEEEFYELAAKGTLEQVCDEALRARSEEARLEAEIASLQDPAAVRMNILRGKIAIPHDLVWLHDEVGPVAELRNELAQLRAQIETHREESPEYGVKVGERRINPYGDASKLVECRDDSVYWEAIEPQYYEGVLHIKGCQPLNQWLSWPLVQLADQPAEGRGE